MRKLLALLIVLTALGALDQGARLFAEGKIEDKVRAELRGAGAVSASISSFPFVGRLLVSGSVPSVEVRADGAALGDLLTAAVEVDLSGVELDRDALFSGNARLRDVDSGTIAVELGAAGLGRVLRVPVAISGGEVRVTVAGRAVAAGVTMDAGALVLRVAGLAPLRVPVARNPLVNCTATTAEVAGGTVRLTCQVDEVPPALRR